MNKFCHCCLDCKTCILACSEWYISQAVSDFLWWPKL